MSDLFKKKEEIVARFTQKIREVSKEADRQVEFLRKSNEVEVECATVETLVGLYERAVLYNACIELVDRPGILAPLPVGSAPVVPLQKMDAAEWPL